MERRKLTAIMLSCAMIFTLAANVPVLALAEEESTVPAAVNSLPEESQIEAAPEVETPGNLTGTAGETLGEVELPSGWVWAEEESILSEGTNHYTARYAVDDLAYNYMEIEGYDIENHCVEREVVVYGIKAEPEEIPDGTEAIKPAGRTAPSHDAGGVEINGTTFPNETFREYIESRFDSDEDGILSEEEISGITEINLEMELDEATRRSIDDLTGIGYLTSLEYLSCSNTEIKELDVSQNPALQLLTCSGTNITEIDVSQNPALQSLACNETNITEIDVSQNPDLDYLSCFDTGITSLDVSKNDLLAYLDCSNTKITSLDVSGKEKLYHLNCGDTELTSLNVKNTPALRRLSCGNTKLNSLDVSSCPSLTSLGVGGNLGMEEIDVSQNFLLEGIGCPETGIRSIDVSKNLALRSLAISKTEISTVDVSQNKNLTGLVCSGTKITSLDVSNNPRLEYLDCSRTGITSLDVSNNLRLTNLLCQITEIEELDVSRNVALSVLYCGSTNIRELDVSHNTVLRQLSCGDTLIHGLDVTKNVQLEDRLMCDRCPLAYLNLGALQVDGFYIYAIPESTELTLYVTEDHFDITEQYPGIDVTKIHNLTGAAIDGSVVTDYTSVKPINYDYDCGTNNGVQQIMNVSIYIEGFNYDPIITARDRTVTVGEPFDPLEGVSASDREDGNLTAALSVTENTVNTRKAGEYQVTYEVSDSQGATVTKTVKVTVKAADTAGKETKPTDTGKKGSTAQKSVQTGDDMNLSLWGITLGVSASLIVGLSRRKGKQIR